MQPQSDDSAFPGAKLRHELIGDYCRRCLLASGDPRDEAAYEAVRRALPSIGYRLARLRPQHRDAVVCLTAGHPKGAADYNRFARKHDRYFALSGTGDIISGVAHVDPGLSPFGPPPSVSLPEVNTRMLIRAGERAAVRKLRNIGEPYTDEPVATVTVAARQPLGLPREYLPVPAWPAEPGAAARPASALAWFFRVVAKADTAPSSGSLDEMAMAVADALHEAGLVSRDGAAVWVEPLPDGYRARLRDVSAAESATFAAALEEVLSPLAQPRYIVPRPAPLRGLAGRNGHPLRAARRDRRP